jgi:O-antigen/teichoic acid export membrane protein
MWFTAISILSWILTFDMGIGNGLRNHLVEPLVNNDNEKIKGYISSAYISVGGIVILLSVLSTILIPWLDWNYIFNISADIVTSDVLVFMVTMLIVGIMLQFWLKLITSVLYALQKSALASLLPLFSSLLILGFTIVAKTDNLNFNIKSLSVAYIFTANIPYLVATLILFFTKLKKSIPNINHFKKKYANQIIKLGGTFFYLQILTMVMFSTNEFLISWLFDPKEVVNFQIYNKIFSLLSTFFNLALTPVWSGVTEACVKKDYLWVKRLYTILNKMLLILVPFEILIIILMPTIMRYWLGNNAIEIYVSYSILFAIYNVLFMKVSIDTSIIAGFGTLKIQTIALTITTLLKVLLSFVIIRVNNTWDSIIIANIIALLPYIVVEHFDIKYRFKMFMKGEKV